MVRSQYPIASRRRWKTFWMMAVIIHHFHEHTHAKCCAFFRVLRARWRICGDDNGYRQKRTTAILATHNASPPLVVSGKPIAIFPIAFPTRFGERFQRRKLAPPRLPASNSDVNAPISLWSEAKFRNAVVTYPRPEAQCMTLLVARRSDIVARQFGSDRSNSGRAGQAVQMARLTESRP